MTTEEKAKAYDRVLEKIHQFIDGYSRREISKEELEDIFSELRESEDERIRKSLIDMLKNDEKCYLKEIAWLEKQGKPDIEKPNSEDERIRKAIHIYLDWLDGRNKDCQPKGEYTIRDMIAWLERQGEQKETLCDKCKKEQPSHSCQDITALGRCAIEKQGEQKPNPCDGCINRKGCINCENGELREVEQKPTDNEMKELLRTEYEKGRADAIAEMQKPAWSEEDESYLNTTIAYLKDATEFKKTAENCIDWLKTLKDRVQPQSKQEWNEYDKIQLNEAIQMIEANGTWIRSEDAVKKVSNWLKSLRPQSTWKPSDEQMEALYVLNLAGKISYAGQGQVLIELYEQLKKLREE